MKNINNSIISVAAVMVMAASFSACRKDITPEARNSSDSSLRFKIETIDIPATRSAVEERHETVDLSEGGLPLFVTASVSVNTGSPAGSVSETRGAIIDKNSMLESCKKKGIPMWMITTNGSNTDAKEGRLKKNEPGATEDYWSLYNKDLKTKIDWIEAGEMGGAKASFLTYYDKDSTQVIKDVDYGNLSFDYVSKPSKFTLGVDENEKAMDAEKQSDLLIAYTAGIDHQSNHGTDQQVNTIVLKYYHPLAAIRFKAPNKNPNIKITRVSINNVKTSGTVKYNTNTNIASNDSFKNAFTWTPGSDVDDYSQKFLDNTDSMTFFIMPQGNLKTGNVVVTFNIVQKDGGIEREYQLTAPASKLGTASWDQGYIYTYTLDTNALGMVDIDIKEDCNNPLTIKQNVKIENKVQSTVYVRALAVANWCTTSGKIVQSFPLVDSGSNKNIDINTTNWLKGKDGYYYCNLPVRGYSDSPNFINSFTQPDNISGVTNGSQITGLHIELSISAQAIESDRYAPNGDPYVVTGWADNNKKILLADGSTDLLGILKF